MRRYLANLRRLPRGAVVASVAWSIFWLVANPVHSTGLDILAVVAGWTVIGAVFGACTPRRDGRRRAQRKPG